MALGTSADIHMQLDMVVPPHAAMHATRRAIRGP